MFAKFRLELKNLYPFVRNIQLCNYYHDAGEELFREQRHIVEQNLNKYFNIIGTLQAAEIEKDWFPPVKADVFLSHSHQDEYLVIALVGYLMEKYNIKCFVDSLIWGYADDLLKKIDDAFCMKTCKYRVFGYERKKCYYNYKLRNQSTAHVYMILQGALAKMIDCTECLIFVNTPHSMNWSEIGEETTTSSPWIYNELLTTCIFPPRVPERYKIIKGSARDSVLLEDGHKQFLQIHYPLPIEKLVKLEIGDFLKAKANKFVEGNYDISFNRFNLTPQELLDQLYRDKNVIKPNVKVITDYNICYN